jgi:hypothetical protein
MSEETEVDSAVVDLQKEVDLQRQYASQNDANFRKERLAKSELETKYTESNTRLAGLEQELSALKAQTSNKSQYHEMDKDIVDESVRANMEALQSQISGLTTKLDTQSNKISDYEQEELKRRDQTQRDAVRDKLCTDLDKEFDPKYRSKANIMAEDRVKEGIVLAPQSTYEAFTLLRDCYTELAGAEKKKESPVTDTGKGSKTPAPKSRENQGTLKNVIDDMKKTFKLTKET